MKGLVGAQELQAVLTVGRSKQAQFKVGVITSPEDRTVIGMEQAQDQLLSIITQIQTFTFSIRRVLMSTRICYIFYQILMNNIPEFNNEKLVKNESLYSIDKDDLKTLLHRSIGALTSLDTKKQFCVGSGVAISRNLVLTAAHNLYDKESNCEHTNFKFYVGVDKVAEKYYEVQSLRYPQEFRSCPRGVRMQYDYALIKLKTPLLFQEYMELSIVCQHCLMDNNDGSAIQIFGFPGGVQENYKALDKFGRKFLLQQYGLARQGRIVQVNPNIFTIAYAISTLSGQSGAPVCTADRIIAIHCGGGRYEDDFNVGRLVTSEVVANIQRWSKELNGNPFRKGAKIFCPYSNQDNKKTTLEQHLKKISQLEKSLRVERQKSLNLNQNPELKQLKQSLLERDQRIKKLQQQLLKVNEKNADLQRQIEGLKNKIKEIQVKKPVIKEQKPVVQQVTAPKFQKTFQQDKSSQKIIKENYTGQQNKKEKEVTTLEFVAKGLQAIDVSKHLNLKELTLNQNKLSQIDVSNNIHLTKLVLWGNQIRKIDLSRNTQLVGVYISQNQLSQIDLAKNAQLAQLSLQQNQLTQINLKNNSRLVQLYLHQNQLKQVDLSGCPKIERLWLEDNYLSNAVFWWSIPFRTYFTCGNQSSSACEVAMLHRKGERVQSIQWGKQYFDRINEDKLMFNKYACKYTFYTQEGN